MTNPEPTLLAGLRGVYWATHFENTYQAWPEADLVHYLDELAEAGANALGFWFDQHEYHKADLDTPGTLAHTRLRRLQRFAREARARKMKVILLALANEAYLDQVHDGIRANLTGRSGRSCYPTQVCVHTEEGAAISTGNLVDLLRRIDGIDGFVSWPYDQGGCDCPHCHPWPRTYIRHSRHLQESLQAVCPGLPIMLSVWDMNAQEVDMVMEELPRHFPDLPPILCNQDSREPGHGLDATAVSGHTGKLRIPLIGFPEVSMQYDGRRPAPWGNFGANPLTRHIDDCYNRQRPLLAGFLQYSEGLYEDLNKWVLLRRALNPDRSLDSILLDYAQRYFGLRQADDFVELVHLLETNWHHEQGSETACKQRALADRLEMHLTPATLRSFRWRVFHLRVRFDEAVTRIRETGRNTGLSLLESCIASLKTLYRAPDNGHPPLVLDTYEPWLK